jgi:hypothetical protein
MMMMMMRMPHRGDADRSAQCPSGWGPAQTGIRRRRPCCAVVGRRRMRDLVMTCVLKLALIPHAMATAEVSAAIGAIALLGVAPRHGVPKDAGFTALARAPCEVTANWAFRAGACTCQRSAIPRHWVLLTPMRRSRRESTALARDQRKAHHEVGAVRPVAQLARPSPGERGLCGDDGVITVEFGAGSFHLDGLAEA